MANLEKVIKVTQTQYNTLASGGTVGSYTGLNDNYVYLVEDTDTYITSNGGTIDGGNLVIEGNDLFIEDNYGIKAIDLDSGNVVATFCSDYMGGEIIAVNSNYQGKPLFANDNYSLIYSGNSDYLIDFTFTTRVLRIYDEDDTGKVIGLDADGLIFTANYDYYLPSTGGTFALTSDIPQVKRFI